jgi:ubiquitin C-terminal hydrolase
MIPIGFPNIGNTCWLNSLLQLLLSSTNFLSLLKLKKYNEKSDIIKLFNNLPTSIFPLFSILQNKFNNYAQQDSHEGLLILLEEIHKETKTLYKIKKYSDIEKQILLYSKNTISPIHSIFQGICKWYDSDNKVRYEPFKTLFCEYDINLQETSINLETLLYKSINARKIICFPLVLLFSIDRIKNRNDLKYILCKEITIHTTNGTHTYKLKGLVIHFGSMNSGHYTALRSYDNDINKWVMCDDNNVTKIDKLPYWIKNVPRIMLYEKI